MKLVILKKCFINKDGKSVDYTQLAVPYKIEGVSDTQYVILSYDKSHKNIIDVNTKDLPIVDLTKN